MWLPIATFVLEQVDVGVDLSLNYWVATALTLIGLLILAYKYFVLDKFARRVAIDKETIGRSTPEINDVRGYFNELLDNHSYRSSCDTKFYQVYNQFLEPSNALQDVKTAALFTTFSEDAKTLHAFVGEHFFVFPDDQGHSPDYPYCMVPELNIDRNMHVYDKNKIEQYDKLRREFVNRVERARESYDAFVARLKQLGHI